MTRASDDPFPAATPPAPIRLPSAPVEPAKPAFPLIACAAPLLVAGIIWAITGSALVLVFAVLSPVIAVAGLLDGRRSHSRQRVRDAAAYATSMCAAEEEVHNRLQQLRRALWRSAPDVQRILVTPHAHGRWSAPDTVTVLLGSGPAPSGLRLEGTDAAEQRELQRRAGVLDQAPILADPAGGIGLIGPGLVVRALARSLLVQIVHQCGPRSLTVRVPPGPEWAWATRLPHVAEGATPASLTLVDACGPADAVPDPTPAPVAVPAQHGGLRIAVAETDAGMPTGYGTIVRVSGASDAEVVLRGGRPAAEPFAPFLVAAQQVRGFGEMLSREAEAAGLSILRDTMPAQVSFAQLRPAGPDDIVPGSLSCALGMGEGGVQRIDLVADGPHALLGGTTGSGKSELLVTWVAALASRYPPSDVTFLLVDFKGGAAFDSVEELPHCVGLITDLDERTAGRALASLAAELRRREHALRECGSRDISDKRARGRLARLVIVVDEFATMLEAFPALHALFVDIAARGRSLGVHLILCTQRPTGVVRDALMANCSLRISLRVNNRADSQAVIGSDAAALIDPAAPGRCVVRRGSAATESCQVATTTDSDIRQIVARVPAPGEAPRRPWLDPLPSLVTADSLDAVVGRAGGTAAGGTAAGAEQTHGGFVLGLLDEPAAQRYSVARYAPPGDGNLMVVGDARTGKSTLVAALAAQAPRSAEIIPADVEGSWDALIQARAALDLPAGRGDAGRHRRDNAPPGRMLLFDDVDAVLARWGDEYRAAATDLLTGLLRDGGASGVHLVITAQRLTGTLQALSALCQSRLVLRLPTAYEHQAAGESAASYDPALPPGGGLWRGARIQLVAAEIAAAPRESGSGTVRSALASLPASTSTLLVVAASPARSATAIRAAGGRLNRVVELAAPQAAGAPGRRLEVSDLAAGTVLVGDADAWQAHWGLLSALRGSSPVLFDGCGLADWRQLTRRRDLPPPLAPGRSRGWLLWPDGAVQRVSVP